VYEVEDYRRPTPDERAETLISDARIVGARTVGHTENALRSCLRPMFEALEIVENERGMLQAALATEIVRADRLEQALKAFMETYSGDENLADPPYVQDCWKMARGALDNADQNGKANG
jgi:hypothetical protein